MLKNISIFLIIILLIITIVSNFKFCNKELFATAVLKNITLTSSRINALNIEEKDTASLNSFDLPPLILPSDYEDVNLKACYIKIYGTNANRDLINGGFNLENIGTYYFNRNNLQNLQKTFIHSRINLNKNTNRTINASLETYGNPLLTNCYFTIQLLYNSYGTSIIVPPTPISQSPIIPSPTPPPVTPPPVTPPVTPPTEPTPPPVMLPPPVQPTPQPGVSQTYIDNIVNNLTNQINSKAPINNLGSTQYALINDTNGNVIISSTPYSKLAYLNDVNDNIQSQLNNKISSDFFQQQMDKVKETLNLVSSDETNVVAIKAGCTSKTLALINNNGGVFLYDNFNISKRYVEDTDNIDRITNIEDVSCSENNIIMLEKSKAALAHIISKIENFTDIDINTAKNFKNNLKIYGPEGGSYQSTLMYSGVVDYNVISASTPSVFGSTQKNRIQNNILYVTDTTTVSYKQTMYLYNINKENAVSNNKNTTLITTQGPWIGKDINVTYNIQSEINKLKTPITDIIKIACGNKITVLVDSTNKVLISGINNTYGQKANNTTTELATGQTNNFNYALNSIENSGQYLSNIIDVACGLNHTVFLENTGNVLACGDNRKGQLAVGDYLNNTSCYLPRYVKIDTATRLSNITQIACGNDFTAYLNNDKKVLLCGDNAKGQLSQDNNTTPMYNNPRYAKTWINSGIEVITNITQIACGANHFAMLEDSGKVLLCGDNSKGQLAKNNTTNNTSCYTGVYALNYYGGIDINLQNIKQIACGENFTAFLENDGKYLFVGEGEAFKLDNINAQNYLIPTYGYITVN